MSEDRSHGSRGPAGTRRRCRRARRLAGLASGVMLIGAGIAPAAAQALGFTAYVTNEGGGTISQYAVRLGGGLAAATPPTVSDAALPFGPGETVDGIPEDIAISPNGRSAYVADWYGIEQYTVGASGTLTPKHPPFLLTGLPIGLGSPVVTDSVAVGRSGRNVYLGSGGSTTGNVTEFTAAADGTLSNPVSVATPPGDFPDFLTVSPDGRSLYVSTGDADNAVIEYAIAPDGTLTLRPQVITTFNAPTGGLVLSADGRDAYLPEYNEIGEFAVAPNGTLTPGTYARTPTVGAGTDAVAFALSATGLDAYAVNQGDDTVSEYAVAWNGRLTPRGTTAPTGAYPGAIAVSPDGSGVYVTNSGDGTVSEYSVGWSGLLTPSATATIGPASQPSSIAIGFTFGGGLL